MDTASKFIAFVAAKLKVVGALALFCMAVLTCVDIVGRLFGHPIFGSIELVSFLGVIAIACSLPFAHLEKGHIGVEIFIRKLPRKRRNQIGFITEFLAFILFSIVSWRMFLFSFKLRESGELSMNLQLPEYWIIFFLAC